MSDQIFLFSVLIAFALVGVFFKDRIKSVKEYALGTRSFSTSVLTASMIATLIGGGSTVGTVAAIYSEGAWLVIPLIAMSVSYCLAAYFIVPRLKEYYGCLSLAEVMGKMYGGQSRKIIAIVAVIFIFGALAAQVKGLSWVIESVFDTKTNSSVLIAFLTIIFYTAFGGITSVIRTDVMQFVIFIIILPLISNEIINSNGGLTNIINDAPNEKMEIFSNIGIWSFVGITMLRLLPDLSPDFFQRLLIGRDTKKNRSALYSVAFVYLLDTVFAATIAFVAFKTMEPNLEAKSVIFSVVQDLFKNQYIFLCFGVALIAIIASTADSIVNTLSVILVNDLLSEKITEEKKLKLLRFSTIISGILALLISLRFEQVLDIIWFFGEFYSSVIVVPLVAGLFLTNKTKQMFLGSVLSTLCSFVFLKLYYEEIGFASVLINLTISAITYFGIGYFQNNVKFRFHLSNGFSDLLSLIEDKGISVEKLGIGILPILSVVVFIKYTDNKNYPMMLEVVAAVMALGLVFVNKATFLTKAYKNIFIICSYWFCYPFISIYWYFQPTIQSFFIVSMVMTATISILVFNWEFFLFSLILGICGGSLAYSMQFDRGFDYLAAEFVLICMIANYLLFISYFIIKTRDSDAMIKRKKVEELSREIELLEAMKTSKEEELNYEKIMLNYGRYKEDSSHNIDLKMCIQHCKKLAAYKLVKEYVDFELESQIESLNSNFSKSQFLYIFNSLLSILISISVISGKIILSITDNDKFYEFKFKVKGLPIALPDTIPYIKNDLKFFNLEEVEEKLITMGHQISLLEDSISVRLLKS